MLHPWFLLSSEVLQLGFEAQSAIALRMMRLAAGSAIGRTEVRRMFADKIAAGAEVRAVAASSLASGHKNAVTAGKVLRVLKRRVRANKRRLSRR